MAKEYVSAGYAVDLVVHGIGNVIYETEEEANYFAKEIPESLAAPRVVELFRVKGDTERCPVCNDTGEVTVHVPMTESDFTTVACKACTDDELISTLKTIWHHSKCAHIMSTSVANDIIHAVRAFDK